MCTRAASIFSYICPRACISGLAQKMELDMYIPGQSIDCVIVGFDRQELRILVLKWKGVDMWALPGGFIQKEEDMDKAATRILKERSGIEWTK